MWMWERARFYGRRPRERRLNDRLGCHSGLCARPAAAAAATSNQSIIFNLAQTIIVTELFITTIHSFFVLYYFHTSTFIWAFFT